MADHAKAGVEERSAARSGVVPAHGTGAVRVARLSCDRHGSIIVGVVRRYSEGALPTICPTGTPVLRGVF